MHGLLCLSLLLLLHGGSWGGHAKEEQNESDQSPGLAIVKRAAGDPFSRRSAVDKNFIRFGRSMNYFHEVPDRSRAKNVMSYARVSRAAKDNFMRFGRPDSQLHQLYLTPTAESSPPASRRSDNFMRFGRGKDNFMRFGRGKDNFMRFGRGKDNFMRFGRGKDNFMRFGRGKDNFMRFGRGKDNFMRFGRGKDNIVRFGRNPEESDEDMEDASEIDKTSFSRNSKSPKNEAGFIRFGRGEPEADSEDQKIDEDGSEGEIGDLVLQGDKPKHGPVIRIKRDAPVTSLWEVEANSFNRASRDSEIMEEIPTLTAKPENEVKNHKKRFVQPDIVFYPDFVNFENDLEPIQVYPEFISDDKRSEGGSSLIRFG